MAIEEKIEEFKKRVSALTQPGGDVNRAIDYLRKNPELVNTSADEGVKCFRHVFKCVDSPELVKCFLDLGATIVWPADRYENAIDNAAKEGRPRSLSLLLATDEGKQFDLFYPLIYASFGFANNSKNSDGSRRAYECMDQLARLGALDARNKEGRTVAEEQVRNWQGGAAVHCMELGADFLPLMDHEGKVKFPTENHFGSEPEERSESQEYVVKHIQASQQRIADCMNYLKPWELRKKLRTAPPNGFIWDAARTEEEIRKLPSLQSELYTLLSVGQAGVLASPEYWKPYGIDMGFAFVEQVDAMIPDYLAHLRGRIDCTALRREADIPHADSVLAGYVQGGAAAGRDAG